jgi:K+-sensing histidine kinase KdpD
VKRLSNQVAEVAGLTGLGLEKQREPSAAADSAVDHESLHIVLIYSTYEHTRAAMNAVVELAKHLRADATLVAVQVVPYTLPLDQPHVSREFCRRRMEELVSRSPLPVRIELLLARDMEFALKQFLPPQSFVLVGVKMRRWWRRTAEEKLARALTRMGHKVALVMI